MKQVTDEKLIEQICNTKEENIYGMFGVWAKLIKITNRYYIRFHCSIDGKNVKNEVFEISEDELSNVGFNKIASEKLENCIKSLST